MIIAYRMMETLFVQARLRQDALQGLGMHIISGVPCDRYPTSFIWMLELPVTPNSRRNVPTIASEKSEHIANLHNVA
jgi:hypothetical protein